MKPPHKLLRALGVGRMVVKVAAHALTLLAALWLLPSAVGLVFFFSSLGKFGKAGAGVWVALVIWALQLCLAGFALYFWATERRRKVTVVKTSGDVSF